MKIKFILVGVALAQSAFAMGGKRVEPIAHKSRDLKGSYSVEFFSNVKFTPNFLTSFEGSQASYLVTGLLKDGKTGRDLDDVVWFVSPGGKADKKSFAKYQAALSIIHHKGETLENALEIYPSVYTRSDTLKSLSQLDGQPVSGTIEMRDQLAPGIVAVMGPGSFWRGRPPANRYSWCHQHYESIEALCEADRGLSTESPFVASYSLEGRIKLESDGRVLRFDLSSKDKKPNTFELIYEQTREFDTTATDREYASRGELCDSYECQSYHWRTCGPDQHVYRRIASTEYRQYAATSYDFTPKSLNVTDPKKRAILRAWLPEANMSSVQVLRFTVRGALTKTWTETKYDGMYCDNEN